MLMVLGTRRVMFCVIVCGLVSGQLAHAEETSSIPTAGMEISVPNGEIFYVPILDKQRMLALIPVAGNRYVGIQISGQMQSKVANIEATALLASPGRSFPVKDCNELKGWKTQLAGKYVAKANTAVVLSGLKALGLPSLTVRVTSARPALNSSSGSSFCSCGHAVALPYPGKCMAPGGNCGWCCYSTAPSGEQLTRKGFTGTP